MKTRVLWIEDSARLELASLLGPVYFGGKYDFVSAEDVTTAVNNLGVREFDVVIVDMRLPPGQNQVWRELYQQAGSQTAEAQLGMKLLYWLIGKDESVYHVEPPSWITPLRIGVFTVESKREIGQDLGILGITVYRQKAADLPDTILRDLIEEILGQTEV